MRCGGDRCGANQIVTWLGTCADCAADKKPDRSSKFCLGENEESVQLMNMDGIHLEEPTPEVS